MKIRFRVWDGEKMWYPSNDDEYAITMSGDLFVADDIFKQDSVAMLSTGLKDKFRQELWEGDIVRYTESYGAQMPAARIVFSDGCFIFGNLEEYVKQWVKQIEVIGNIYENPELLKEVA